MRIAQREFAVAEPLADALEAVFGPSESIVRFGINGDSFVGVREDIWAAAELPRADAIRFRQHVRGRIAICGVRHVVLSMEEEASAPDRPALAAALTHRELQIAQLIVTGAENKEIARKLGISHFTVREHVRRIFHKLNVAKRSALAAILAGAGLGLSETQPPRP